MNEINKILYQNDEKRKIKKDKKIKKKKTKTN